MKKYIFIILVIFEGLLSAQEAEVSKLQLIYSGRINPDFYTSELYNSFDTDIQTESKDFDHYFVYINDYIEICVLTSLFKIYLPKNYSWLETAFYQHPKILFTYKDIDNKYKNMIAGKYFKRFDVQYKTSISSGDEDILKVNNDFSMGIINPGKTQLSIYINKYFFTITFEAIGTNLPSDIPYGEMTVDELVDSGGLPDKIKKIRVDWPDSKTINGFYYNPDFKTYEEYEHWTYDKYPNLVISIGSNGYVMGFRTVNSSDW